MVYMSTDWWTTFKNHAAGGFAVKDYNDGVFNYALVTDPENQYAILVSGDYSSMTTANIPERFTDLSNESAPVRYYITAIGPNAFKNCTKLQEVNFNSRSIINTIAQRAFYECSALKSIALPGSVTSIGDNAFYDCSSLTSVEIPDSVTSIGDNAFEDCSSLTSLIIPGSVKTIGNDAFNGCRGLTSVTIGNSVKEIGESAFRYCTGLTRAEFASVESLCGIEFGNYQANPLSYAHNLYIAGEEVKDLVIPNSVTEIGKDAFYGCTALTSLTIPESVTSIGDYAFYSCSDLRSVVLLDGDEIKFGDGVFSNTNIRTAYVGRPIATGVIPVNNLETLTIGNTVTEISASAWSNARYLRTLKLGSSLASIGESAFSGCTALTEVVVPPSVETIEASAFAGNTALASIIMGHNVKSIGDKAYDGCPANTISITAQTPPTAPNSTFSNYTGKLYLQGQKAVNAYYDAYTCWDRFNGYVMIEPTEMKYEGEQKLNGKPGDTFQLKATLMPENVTLPQVFWRSTNPDIATVDKNGLVTLHADLEDVMYAASESGDAGCKIIAESLYADGPVVEFDVTVAQNGVDDILVDSPADESAIDYASSYDVYNLSGVWVGDSLEGLAHGFYVVRQGGIVKKVAVK